VAKKKKKRRCGVGVVVFLSTKKIHNNLSQKLKKIILKLFLKKYLN